MKLGNIVIDHDFINHDKIKSLNLDILNIVEDYIENNKPTLLIGWKKTKKSFNNKVTILSKTINDRLFWTFNPKEKLQDFNEDIDKFVNLLTDDFVKKIKHESIDPIILNTIDIIEFIKNLHSEIDIVYVNDEMIYYLKNNIVYSIDINVLNFLNMNIKEVMWYLETNSKKIIFENYEEDGCIYKYNKIFKMNNLEKYIPYIIYNDDSNLINT